MTTLQRKRDISYRSRHDGRIAERSWSLLDIAPSSVLVYQIYIVSVWQDKSIRFALAQIDVSIVLFLSLSLDLSFSFFFAWLRNDLIHVQFRQIFAILYMGEF